MKSHPTDMHNDPLIQQDSDKNDPAAAYRALIFGQDAPTTLLPSIDDPPQRPSTPVLRPIPVCEQPEAVIEPITLPQSSSPLEEVEACRRRVQALSSDLQSLRLGFTRQSALRQQGLSSAAMLPLKVTDGFGGGEWYVLAVCENDAPSPPNGSGLGGGATGQAAAICRSRSSLRGGGDGEVDMFGLDHVDGKAASDSRFENDESDERAESLHRSHDDSGTSQELLDSSQVPSPQDWTISAEIRALQTQLASPYNDPASRFWSLTKRRVTQAERDEAAKVHITRIIRDRCHPETYLAVTEQHSSGEKDDEMPALIVGARPRRHCGIARRVATGGEEEREEVDYSCSGKRSRSGSETESDPPVLEDVGIGGKEVGSRHPQMHRYDDEATNATTTNADG